MTTKDVSYNSEHHGSTCPPSEMHCFPEGVLLGAPRGQERQCCCAQEQTQGMSLLPPLLSTALSLDDRRHHTAPWAAGPVYRVWLWLGLWEG